MDNKTQARNEVKESIVLICRMLKYSGIYTNLSPDHVRQGKFDKSEAVEMLSEVLFALLNKTCEHNVTVDKQAEIIQDVLVRCRYPRICYLFDKNRKFHSSREILLAVSWFMDCDDTIERIRLKAMQPVNIVHLSANRHKNAKQKKYGKPTSMKTLSIVEQTNYISWIVSQINLLKNQIISLESGNAHCKVKISSTSKIEFHEDPLLLMLLRYPSLKQEYERELEKKVLLLQACNRWKQVQHVYWSWMDSVLSAAVSEGGTSNELPKIPLASSHKQPPLMETFEEKLGTLQKLFAKEKDTHINHINERRELLATLQPEQKAEIDKEIILLRKLIRDTSHKVKLKLAKDGDSGNRMERNGHLLEKSIPLSIECERLSKMNKTTSEQISIKRLDYKETIMEMSQKFSEVVLVPPDVPKRKLQT